MALLPIFKPYTPQKLTDVFSFEFDLPEWVSIEFSINQVKTLDTWLDSLDDMDTVEYECNRYDAIYHDTKTGKTLSVYLYMNESRDQIIAVDEVVQDVYESDTRYSLYDTPIGTIIDEIRRGKNDETR